jgi:DNA-binding NtrC family response regulator
MEGKAKILIVDDEEIVCNMAKRCLEQEGYQVTTFVDSTKAMAAIKEERFDVVITDLKMKEVDGLQLLEFTKTRWPDTRVIMLTAFATLETAMEAVHKQVFDYFAKPLRIIELKASVNRALKERNEIKEGNPHDPTE